MMDKHIGAQYFTIRKKVTNIGEFDLACQKIAETGYKIVQISGIPLEAGQMREVLDKYRLKAVTSHRKYEDFIEHLDEVIDYNKKLGVSLCGLGMMPVELADSNEKVTRVIKELEKVCEVLKSEDMYFGYHNHSLEFAKIDGKMIFERLIEETDPERFCFIADTYWLQVGGQTPQDMIRRLGSRAQVVHFKDLAIYPAEWKVPQMCEVGRGNLNWDAIISACEDAGVRYAIVEQDKNHVDDDPFKSLKISYDYLATKGFV